MNAKQTAVVLLELQNDFLSEGGKLYPLLKSVLEEYDIIRNLNRLIADARAHGMLIVHTPIQFSPDYREMGHCPYGIMKVVKDTGALIRGTWGAEIAKVIDRQDSDIAIDGKSSIDAFAGTHLDFVLRAHGITTVALAGQLTNVCIESTMRSAYDKGYRVFGITDASATVGFEQYRFSVQNNWPMFSIPVTHREFLDDITESFCDSTSISSRA
ncbi:isochorismatase family cysteine hydrolase [Methylocaldum sp.]|uniref:cysteine hydrolase family protein n=1 Tax=Methylocaldum sp. TaxID=1969727 RepID=UPI002D38E857|nr:isochorismatase family cysteine hydrolase [Methylocaldum sp.]HYE35683.1 isochorismatase family cysteine hydrolase [Methylocaldum sp.]